MTLPEDYVYHEPPPWAHQREAVVRHGDRRVLALNFDTRTGKSRVAIDTAAYRYERGDVDGLLIVAYPNGVPRVWVEQEIPAYLPPRVPRLMALWRAGHQNVRGFNARFDALVKFDGLAIFAVNAEALSRKQAAVKRYINRFLAARRTFLVIDECDCFAVPGSARSRAMGLIARHPNVVAKRILSATMITESPFEAYTQYNLLDRRILDCPTFLAFKHRYAEYEKEWDPATDELIIKKSYNRHTNSYFETIAKDDEGRPLYRNLDDLQRRIAPYTMRVRRSDVTDAPPKVYQPRYFQLTEAQRRVYDKLRDEYRVELDDGAVWTAREAIVRLTRLQQIASNFLPGREEGTRCAGCAGQGCADCDGIGIVVTQVPLQRLGDEDPRRDALQEELRVSHVPTIVWARFTAEVDAVMSALPSAVRFDGHVGERERAESLRAFQAGEVTCLVGNQQAGGRGLRMDRAELMVFYSNQFSLRSRVQAEDRAEAIGKKVSTGVVDLLAEDTVDEKIVAALRAKRDLAAIVTGEHLKEWL